MPAYQFYRLVKGQADGEAGQAILFNDAAALSRAMRLGFAEGCDVWQGERFVGRYHAAQVAEAEETPDVGSAAA